MIMVLAGTAEGREIVNSLLAKGKKVLACAATLYGAKLLEHGGAGWVSGTPLSGDEMGRIMDDYGVSALVDATHPYAEIVSITAFRVCSEKGIRYIRYQRPASQIPDLPLIHRTENYLEAAEKACALGEVIFLSTGSKTVDIFLRTAKARGRRVVVRILPQPEALQKCLDLGLLPSNIVAMQGPFGEHINTALFKHYQVDVLVTKDSGSLGGANEKISAAIKLGLNVVVVNRPKPQSGAVESLEDLINII